MNIFTKILETNDAIIANNEVIINALGSVSQTQQQMIANNELMIKNNEEALKRGREQLDAIRAKQQELVAAFAALGL